MKNQLEKTGNTLYPLEELRQILNGKLKQTGAQPALSSFSIDSRTLERGDWFFCIRGERTDGHNYIAAALERGAAGVVLDPFRIPKNLFDREFPRIEVEDPNLALREWAAEARRRFRGKVLGITGSNGKTSTKEILARLCIGMGVGTHATRGNFNNLVGVPLTLLEASREADWWMVEMGTNHIGEIAELSRIVKPNGAILTGISESHLEFLENTEGVAREKAGIIRGMPPGAPLVMPSGIKHENLIQRIAVKSGVRMVRVRIEGESDGLAEHELKLLEHDGEVICFELFGMEFRIRSLNPLQLRNLAKGLVLLKEQGVEVEQLCEAVSGIELSVSGRFDWKPFDEGWLVDDSYNANPGSFRSVLGAIRRMYPQMELTVVAGPMAELGESSLKLHHEVGGMLFNSGCIRLFILGEDSGEGYLEGWCVAGGKDADAVRFEKLPKLLEAFWGSWSASGIVLVKGSRSAQMERFVEAVLETNRN